MSSSVSSVSSTVSWRSPATIVSASILSCAQRSEATVSAEAGEIARGEPAGEPERRARRAGGRRAEGVGARGARRLAMAGDWRTSARMTAVSIGCMMKSSPLCRCTRSGRRSPARRWISSSLARGSGSSGEHPLVVLTDRSASGLFPPSPPTGRLRPAGGQGGSASAWKGRARRRCCATRCPAGGCGGAGDADADEERRAREGGHLSEWAFSVSEERRRPRQIADGTTSSASFFSCWHRRRS